MVEGRGEGGARQVSVENGFWAVCVTTGVGERVLNVLLRGDGHIRLTSTVPPNPAARPQIEALGTDSAPMRPQEHVRDLQTY